MNDLVAECLIKDFDQRPFMQVSVRLFLLIVYYRILYDYTASVNTGRTGNHVSMQKEITGLFGILPK